MLPFFVPLYILTKIRANGSLTTHIIKLILMLRSVVSGEFKIFPSRNIHKLGWNGLEIYLAAVK